MLQTRSLGEQEAQQADHPKVQQTTGQNPDAQNISTLYYSKMHTYVLKKSYHRSFIAKRPGTSLD